MAASGLVTASQEVLKLVSAQSGITIDLLLGPSRARTVSELRSAAMFLLRTELGLSAADTGRVLGRSGGTVRDLSRLVARRQRAGALVADVTRRLSAAEIGAGPQIVLGWKPQPALGLSRLQRLARLTQRELAQRAGIGRETLGRIERGRSARPETIGRLAAALSTMPDTLMDAQPGWRGQLPRPRQISANGSVDEPGSHSSAVVGNDNFAPTPGVEAIASTLACRQLPVLKDCRTKAGLKQNELAAASGVARETLGRIEGGRPARLSTIRSLATALLVLPSVLTARPISIPSTSLPGAASTVAFLDPTTRSIASAEPTGTTAGVESVATREHGLGTGPAAKFWLPNVGGRAGIRETESSSRRTRMLG